MRMIVVSTILSYFPTFGAHQCERKFQEFVSTLASNSTEITRPEWHLDDTLHDQQESSEFHQNDVVVIDP